MSISLIKEREEKVKISLTKKFKPETEINCICNFVIDVSGSMHYDFSTGKIKKIVDRIFPIASVMDKKNNQLGMYVFSDRCKKLTPVTIDNYDTYVNKYIINKDLIGGGTNYEPFISKITSEYQNTDIPVYNIVISDGDNSDHYDTKKVIMDSSGQKIFWQFVGIGNQRFNFLQQLDDLSGRINDNADFFAINDLDNISDEDLYDRLLTEFPSFLENFKSVKLTWWQRIVNKIKSWLN